MCLGRPRSVSSRGGNPAAPGQAHQVQYGRQDPVHGAHLLSTEADHPHGFHHCQVVALLVTLQGLQDEGLSTPGPRGAPESSQGVPVTSGGGGPAGLLRGCLL